jgi:short-subunit dehydrogenase
MFTIRDKVALVTGSTAGLGRELAWQLCQAGTRVVLNARGRERLEATEKDFRDEGFEVSGISGDVSVAGDCRAIVEHCIKTFGRLDILVCNAGISSGGLFEETTAETFKTVFEINTLGTIYLSRFAYPHIREGRGSMIFISSLAGLVGLPFSSLYSSSKMALTAIAQSLQVELKGSGVHVGIVYVGFLKNAPEKRVLGPTGKLQPTGDRSTFRLQPMDRASRAIIRVIRKRRRTAVLSFMGKWLYFSMRFTPWLIRWILVRSRERARLVYQYEGD